VLAFWFTARLKRHAQKNAPPRVFSSEVETGSRKENASRQ
jgi:hypothetical protein